MEDSIWIWANLFPLMFGMIGTWLSKPVGNFILSFASRFFPRASKYQNRMAKETQDEYHRLFSDRYLLQLETNKVLINYCQSILCLIIGAFSMMININRSLIEANADPSKIALIEAYVMVAKIFSVAAGFVLLLGTVVFTKGIRRQFLLSVVLKDLSK